MAQLVIPIDIPPTLLSTNISAGATTLQVADTTGFTPTGVLSLDRQETVTYTGITARTFTGVTRGTNGTTARAFQLGVEVYQAEWLATEAEVASRPTTDDTIAYVIALG